MHSKRSYPMIILLLVLSILEICSFLPAAGADSSITRTLTWTPVKTPANGPANVIRTNSEINSMSLGDGMFYCADTTKYGPGATGALYRSLDKGYTFTDITASLTLAHANLPVWSVAVAPDDPKFAVAITDSSPTPPGPKGPQRAYVSIDGGNTWQDAGLQPDTINSPGINGIGNDEYISCVEISRLYGSGLRDIAIGTRTTTGQGQVLNHQYGSISIPWISQSSIGSVTSLKFSPAYPSDNTLVAISCDAAATRLHLGQHDTVLNATIWDTPYSPGPSPIPYPIKLADVGTANVIGTDLALPYDYDAYIPGFSGCFASVQAGIPFLDVELRSVTTGVFYINTIVKDATPFVITPPGALPIGHKIYSIAYDGSEATGTLLAGEATANPLNALVPIHQSQNAQSSTKDSVIWFSSQDFDNGYKSPTGGGTSGRANAILAWQRGIPYCGTSSENDISGGTAFSASQWPGSKLTPVSLDESAFSYSFNGLSVDCQEARPDQVGLGWNQIGLIDTAIDDLSDSACFEPQSNTLQTSSTASSTSTSTSTTSCAAQGVLYVSSLNKTPGGFDSVWRSTSSTYGNSLGDIWERVLILNSSNNGLILRVNTKEAGTTTAVIVGDLTTPNIFYSDDQGQTWKAVLSGIISLRDLTFKDEGVIYILEDYRVSQLYRGSDNTTWIPQLYLNTDLPTPGHSIAVPLTNPQNEDLVFVGTGIAGGGKPAGYVAWIDFSQHTPQFTVLKMLPEPGNVHVVVDTAFDVNSMIYVGINADEVISGLSAEGSIYRWTLGQSTDWDELQPPDLSFFGIATAGDVLYGAFNFNSTTLLNSGGVDRTLYPRDRVPPPPEWDSLIDGLPVSGNINYPVAFTGEPGSLKASANSNNNTLWAIDSTPYDFDKQQGRLWKYIDSAARASPWPTAPPAGSLIGADPVTGRSQQIDMRWRPLQDMFGYDLLMAKDVNFTTLLSQNLNFFPVDNKTGAWIVGMDNTTGTMITTLDQSQQQSPGAWIPPGILEAGKSYWWKVRGSRTVTGAAIHSLWSPVMLFSVKPGFAVRSEVNGPELLTPVGGVCNDCQSSVGFSWTPIKNAQKYEFVLAGDQALNKVITRIVTTTTAYKYVNKLDPGRVYFWQVKAVAPFESGPSPTGTFTVGGSQPLLSWAPIPPSQLWIGVMIATGLLILLIIAVFIYNYNRRY